MTDTINICYGCLCSDENNSLINFPLKNGFLQNLLQVESIQLCYLCKKLAQKAELFVQNVQSNQILLENYENAKDTFDAISKQILPNLRVERLCSIELNEDTSSNEEIFFVLGTERDSKVKIEMKEEGIEPNFDEHYDDDFNGHDDDQDQECKLESIPLTELIKKEYEIEEIDVKSLKKSLLRNKNKKISKEQHKNTKKLKFVEKLFLTKKQFEEERTKMAQDVKYLNSTFKCVDCLKGFNFKPSYDSHVEKHRESSGDFECKICKLRMVSKEKLTKHKTCHFVRYRCTECDLTRVTRAAIKEHYTVYHCFGYNQYNCTHCTKTFKRRVTLRKHICYTHKRKERVVCAHCHKTYANKDVLKTHLMRRHSQQIYSLEKIKSYVCQDCGQAFSAPSLLKYHSIKHKNVKDYYCVECNKCFKSEYSLKHHLRTSSSHVSYKELPLKCLHCEKRFAIKRDLEQHMNRIHLNIKPFKCNRCDKAYVNSWGLKEHIRVIHEGYKRPLKFPCPTCNKVFNSNHILKSHIRTHTGERPYQCSKCGAQFSQAGILATHNKLIHLKLARDGRPKPVSVK